MRRIYELDHWVDRDNKNETEMIPASVFHKFRIVHFLALNGESTRHRLSKKLEIPYASTVAAVKELNSLGTIRNCRTTKARTGLFQVFYCITSFGMLQLINLHSPSRPTKRKEFVKIVEAIQNDFPEIAENCKGLPIWNLFLMNWSIFDLNGAALEMTSWLAGTAKSYTSSRVFLDISDNIKESIKSSDSVALRQNLDLLVDSFYEVLVERILNIWLAEDPNLKFFLYKSPRIFDIFMLNPALKHLLNTNFAKYIKTTEERLGNLQSIKEELRLSAR
jgi:hypothetical protein